MELKEGRQAQPLSRASIRVRSNRSQVTRGAEISELILYLYRHIFQALKRAKTTESQTRECGRLGVVFRSSFVPRSRYVSQDKSTHAWIY
jgi:hypothetical protein